MNTHGLKIAVVPMCLAAAAWGGVGDGLHAGSWLFSPYLELSASREDNVYKTRSDTVSDTYFEPEVGLRLNSSSETNRLTLGGNAFLASRQYSTETGQDFVSYGGNLTLRYGAPEESRIEAIQSYRHVSDNDRHAADVESSDLSSELVQDIHTLSAERDVMQLGGAGNLRLTDKLELAVDYRYSSIVYDSGDFLDLQGNVAQAEALLQVTDKTAGYLGIRYGLQSQEGMADDATLTTLWLGSRLRNSDKLTYHAGVGLERYTLPLEMGEETTDAINADIAADWFVSEKWTLRGGFYNGTQLSSFYSMNGLEYYSGWLGAGYRWSPQWIFSVRGIYRMDDYLKPVADGDQMVDRSDMRAEAHARLDYHALQNALRLYLEYMYDKVDSNIDPVDYVGHRIILGASIRY